MAKFGKYREVWPLWYNVPMKYQEDLIRTKDEKKDKSLVILEIHKSFCVCGIRNNNTMRIGIPFTCKRISRGGHDYFEWKNKLYKIDTRYGWVI